MRTKLFILLVLAIVGCNKNQETENIEIDKQEETTVVASKVDIKKDFFISLYSYLQANESGLYVTPSNIIDNFVLWKYPHKKSGEDLRGIIREGKGPKELLKIFASAKTVNGDTLLFYSPNSAKYLGINNNGTILDHVIHSSKGVINTGYNFAYNNGYLLIPSFNKDYNSKSLFTLVNVNRDTKKDVFEPRIPAGYEPAIRNQTVAMAALPNGFAISFVGDRKVHIVDLKGEQKDVLVFGESEPIPDPFRVDDPKQAPSSKPYVTKIELHNGNLLVLVDNVIWILDYPSYRTKTLLKILRDSEEKSVPVIDFSVTDETIFARMGRDGLYSVEMNPNWLK